MWVVMIFVYGKRFRFAPSFNNVKNFSNTFLSSVQWAITANDARRYWTQPFPEWPQLDVKTGIVLLFLPLNCLLYFITPSIQITHLLKIMQTGKFLQRNFVLSCL